MRSKLLVPALALLVGMGISLAMGECAVRLASHTDADGNVILRSTRLRPYRLPSQTVRAQVQTLKTRSDTCISYDPDTGWAPSPGARCHDGMYLYDARGIRSDGMRPELAVTAPEGARRIALVGDSFTHGDDVPYEQTWGQQYEALLDERGIAAEVVNLGVGGYGMDQALLRLRKLGRPLAPDVVVFGFQIENALRNLNLIRPLYYRMVGLPFSKPRFVLEDEGLRLINVPALPPEQVAPTLDRFDEWELVGFEGHYAASDFRPGLLYRSRLAALVVGRVERTLRRTEAARRARYARGSEAAELAMRIVSRMAAEVEAAGGEFVVLHIPRRQDLEWLASSREPLIYDELLTRLAEGQRLVDPSRAMLDQMERGTPLDDLFADPGNGHYSELGNRLVAKALVESASLARSAGPLFSAESTISRVHSM